MTDTHSTEKSAGRELFLSGKGEPLVLLHGWSMNAAVWEPVQQRLETDWMLYRINLPGHGGRAYSMTDGGLNDWLTDVTEKAPDGAVWLGWSLGGLLALAVASRFPERVKRLILVASTPKFVATQDWPHAVDTRVWEQFAANAAQDPTTTNDQFLAMQALGSDSPVRLGKRLGQLQTEGGATDGKALMDGLRILRQTDLRDELKRVSCPIHWLLGDGDQLVPFKVSESIAAIAPANDIQIVSPAGHALFVSRPDCLLELTDRIAADR